MRVKKIILFFLLVMVVFMSFSNSCFALEDLQEGMEGVTAVEEGLEGSGIATALNTVIGILQIAGTGISLIVVTMLGIKYLVASVGDKAEIKKQAMPIVIGCVLLFGAVKLMKIVADFTEKILPSS